MSQHFGYVPDPEGTAKIIEEMPENLRTFTRAASPAVITQERKDTFLWLALLTLLPTWRRGAQGIGDCVSWGAELAATILLALQALDPTRGEQWLAEAATEPIYGGSRVEVRGGGLGGWGDGSYGAAAAKWLRQWGVLLRIDYSEETGNQEHDLRKYSARKAKNWGNYGCGGERDDRGQGLLDMVAAQYPVKSTPPVRTAEEAAIAIQNGCPVTVASGVGYGDMTRNSQGVVRARGSWPHQMMFAGVKWVNGEPWLRQFQSWGHSASGPDPGIEHEKVSWCSWWTVPEDADRQLRQNDSFAFSDAIGIPARDLSFVQPGQEWG